MGGWTLLGWDYDTWKRAFDWAHVELAVKDVLDDHKLPQFVAVRRAWLRSGGSADGPNDKVAVQ